MFDRIVVSTDSERIQEIALAYGADVPFLRPPEFATATSPDIEWIKHVLGLLEEEFESFAILRPTSPFRQTETIQRARRQFLESGTKIDSLRAVELCQQHPGKMWIVDGPRMAPLLDQSHLEVAWHAGQYQALPKVYIQNSSLEMAWTRVVWDTNSREGSAIAPFLTIENEGLSIDYEEDWFLVEHLLKIGKAQLPLIDQPPIGSTDIK